MSENEISVLDVLKSMVMPKLDSIEKAIKEEHEYNERTYVRKDTQAAAENAVEKQDTKLWTRRGILATMFGVGSGFVWTLMNHVWR